MSRSLTTWAYKRGKQDSGDVMSEDISSMNVPEETPLEQWPAEDAKARATQSALCAAARHYGSQNIRQKWNEFMGPETPGVEAEISKMLATLSAIDAATQQTRRSRQEIAHNTRNLECRSCGTQSCISTSLSV